MPFAIISMNTLIFSAGCYFLFPKIPDWNHLQKWWCKHFRYFQIGFNTVSFFFYTPDISTFCSLISRLCYITSWKPTDFHPFTAIGAPILGGGPLPSSGQVEVCGFRPPCVAVRPQRQIWLCGLGSATLSIQGWSIRKRPTVNRTYIPTWKLNRSRTRRFFLKFWRGIKLGKPERFSGFSNVKPFFFGGVGNSRSLHLTHTIWAGNMSELQCPYCLWEDFLYFLVVNLGIFGCFVLLISPLKSPPFFWSN